MRVLIFEIMFDTLNLVFVLIDVCLAVWIGNAVAQEVCVKDLEIPSIFNLQFHPQQARATSAILSLVIDDIDVRLNTSVSVMVDTHMYNIYPASKTHIRSNSSRSNCCTTHRA